MIKLSEILHIYKESQVDEFLKKHYKVNLTEKNLSNDEIKNEWFFLGDNKSNGSNVSMLKNGEKGLVERITNAIDAVIEKEKNTHALRSAQTSDVIIKKAFPKFYENKKGVIEGTINHLNAKDAVNSVILIVHDGSKSNKPTFDVIDKGTGIEGDDFPTTILSINQGNKLNRDKMYLIGAFGQGGSTSLPFTYATIIVSKKNNKYYFTIIKGVELIDYKNIVYVYTKVCEAVEDDESKEFTSSYFDSECGTMVRMVETDISKRFRDNEVTKPGMLGDYINTELFNTGLPVKIVENRKSYSLNTHIQNRYSYGSFLKLQTSEYVSKEYSGTIDIVHKDRNYKIDYYLLLPKNEDDWGKEAKCKIVFEQFNVYHDPILYIVNGQTITTERFTRLNNVGLNFLRYRLLVVINLDVLGNEKYKFFTSDRAQIRDTDLTHGFLDSVIKALSNVSKLREINSIIAEKSVSSSIDSDLIEEVSKDVKNQYTKFLKGGTMLPGRKTNGVGATEKEDVHLDVILKMEITSSKAFFYKDQVVSFTVTTQAQKHINESALIYAYVDDKNNYDYQRIAMNGRIQYNFPEKSIKRGMHTIQFTLYNNNINTMSTEIVAFEISDEMSPEKEEKQLVKNLDLQIIIVDESSVICDISRDQEAKKITVKLCFENDELKKEVFGRSASVDQISSAKEKMIKPIVLFALFYGDNYENIDEDQAKNSLIVSFVKSLLITMDKK